MSSVQKEKATFTQRLSQLLNRFKSERRGNIAIMFAFMLAILMLFSGGAVDYTRYNTIRADITESLDAAALAMARYNEIGGPEIDDLEEYSPERNAILEAFGEKLFNENYAHHGAVSNLDVQFNISPAEITASASGELKTLLLHVGRKMLNPGSSNSETDNLEMDVNVTIAQAGRGKIELALVLDVTGSMDNTASGSSQSKLDDLKDAVDEMLTVMYGSDTTSENLKVGVVPFSAAVNAGGASEWQDSWSDEDADSFYHGSRFFHVNEDGEVDMDTKVNHFALYDSISDTEWQGCVEARPYPLDELDTVPGDSASSTDIASYNVAPDGSSTRTVTAFTRAPSLQLSSGQLQSADNSRFVPLFWPDEPDCNTDWIGRCPWPDGYSWWNKSTTINIGGTNTAINYARYWFVDPSYDSWSEGDYENRHFIDDQKYIGRNEGEPVARYAHIVKQYRNLGEGGLSSDEQTWKDFLDVLGADHYFDTDLDADHDAFADDYANHDGDYSTSNYEEYVMRNAYVGWWNPANENYDYKYDLGGSSGYGPEPTCPEPILALTNDRDDVEDYMDDLEADGFTNTAIGAMWGWRVLSPGAPFTEGVLYNDSDWAKAVVIMTDGFNDAGEDKDTPWGSEMTAFGFASEERMGSGVDYPSYYNSSWNSDEMRDHMDEKMLRICARMKEKGILVYTIVFGLDDTDTENLFKACATDTIEPYYYKAPSGDELEEAFGNIAADLVSLHISQ